LFLIASNPRGWAIVTHAGAATQPIRPEEHHH